jgi:hypothetical protein
MQEFKGQCLGEWIQEEGQTIGYKGELKRNTGNEIWHHKTCKHTKHVTQNINVHGVKEHRLVPSIED